MYTTKMMWIANMIPMIVKFVNILIYVPSIIGMPMFPNVISFPVFYPTILSLQKFEACVYGKIAFR